MVLLHPEHMGISKMKSLAMDHIFWPGLDREIENLGKACHECLTVKQASPRAPLQPWVWPSRPSQRLHIDYAWPLMKKHFLNIAHGQK